MSKGWIKYFTDGSIEEGFDYQIDANQASWTKGKLKNIKSVNIIGEGYNCTLEINNTEWYQFDRFITAVGSDSSSRVLRVIQAQIKEHHIGKYLLFRSNEQYHKDILVIHKSKEIKDLSLYKTVNYLYLDDKFLNQWISIVGNTNQESYSIIITQKGKV